jgi:hypothetical protein
VSLSNKKVGNWIINKCRLFGGQNLSKHESLGGGDDDRVLSGEEVRLPPSSIVKSK